MSFQSAPTEGTDSAARTASDGATSGVPRAMLLPDRFVAFLYNEAGALDREERWSLNLPCGELPLLADPGVEAHSLFADQAAWIGDFAAAERLGMAHRISGARDRYSRLIVVGLREGDAKQGGEALASLLEAHRFSSGISLVPYGTATNNTAEGSSGFVDDEGDAEGSYRVECQPLTTDSSTLTLGALLAEALGLESATLQRLAHADEPVDSIGGAARTLLWPALGGHFLKHMLCDPVGSEPGREVRLWNHFRRLVDARGPLPAIRVGKQPYGIVPVTGIRNWVPSLLDSSAFADTGDDEQFDRTLAEILQLLFDRWLEIAQTKPDLVPRVGRPVDDPDPDQELLEVLAMQPAAVEIHQCPVVDGRYMGSIFPSPHLDYLVAGASAVPMGSQLGSNVGVDPTPTHGGSGGAGASPMA
ncbi:MAG: hypothetical protein JJ992_07690, partial [Planctomycetes bacterium]|nr:hypothetical protein [Planctomycetota bacterium]